MDWPAFWGHGSAVSWWAVARTPAAPWNEDVPRTAEEAAALDPLCHFEHHIPLCHVEPHIKLLLGGGA